MYNASSVSQKKRQKGVLSKEEKEDVKMKVMMRKIGVALLVVVLACSCLVGCGAISIDEIKGDWTVDTLNGQSLADYAASVGMDENSSFSNWTITADKKIEATNIAGTQTYNIELKSNGFEVMDGDKIIFSVEYNKDAGTLTYTVEASGNKVTTVMKKGKFEPTQPAEESEEATEDSEEGSEEATEETEETEEGDEESGDEESGDEESGDEESGDESEEEE